MSVKPIQNHTFVAASNESKNDHHIQPVHAVAAACSRLLGCIAFQRLDNAIALKTLGATVNPGDIKKLPFYFAWARAGNSIGLGFVSFLAPCVLRKVTGDDKKPSHLTHFGNASLICSVESVIGMPTNTIITKTLEAHSKVSEGQRPPSMLEIFRKTSFQELLPARATGLMITRDVSSNAVWLFVTRYLQQKIIHIDEAATGKKTGFWKRTAIGAGIGFGVTAVTLTYSTGLNGAATQAMAHPSLPLKEAFGRAFKGDKFLDKLQNYKWTYLRTLGSLGGRLMLTSTLFAAADHFLCKDAEEEFLLEETPF